MGNSELRLCRTQGAKENTAPQRARRRGLWTGHTCRFLTAYAQERTSVGSCKGAGLEVSPDSKAISKNQEKTKKLRTERQISEQVTLFFSPAMSLVEFFSITSLNLM